jgi:hypothetical protein
MKKTFYALALCLALACPLRAEEAGPSENLGLLKSLQANRSLLLKYQNEYVQLKGSLGPGPRVYAIR